MLYAYLTLYTFIIYGMLVFTDFKSIFGWLLLASLQLFFREVLTNKLRDALKSKPERVNHYFKYSIYISFFGGLTWGYLVWLIFKYIPYEYHYIGVAVILGVAASAMASLSIIFISYLSFILPMMFILIGALVYLGTKEDYLIASMVFVYIIVIIPIARSLYERTKESFSLSASLKESQEQLHKLNETLEQRVQEKSKDLEYSYSHDLITDLANLKSFQNRAIAKHDNFIILLDIKEFGITNKQHGKSTADTLLIEIAKLLKKHLQDNAYLFRAENDKFIIYKEESSIAQVKALSEQILAFFSVYPISIKGNEFLCTFRVGISEYLDKHKSLIHSEYALMLAKKKGFDLFVYDQEEDELQTEQKTIESLIYTKELILNENLIPYYQAIYDIKKETIVKYECLVRGVDKDEIIPPYKFLEAAKRLGLSTHITRIMIDKSFQNFQDTQHEFSINLTGADLLDSNFINYLDIKLKHYNIQAKNITFEILENITMHSDSSTVLSSLHLLKERGCKIAIDDFGIENSNFSRLLDIELDYIKIDGLFIKNIHKNEKDKKVVKAIVGLAKTLGVQTVAEYVENTEISEVLQELMVDYAQGYLIGKPQERIQIKSNEF